MALGYSNKVIKDKQDKGHYLSDAEKAYIDMEAQQAAEQFVERNKRKGSAFLVAALRKAGELAQKVADEEQRKQGKPPQDRSDDDGRNNDPGNIFGSIYGGRE